MTMYVIYADLTDDEVIVSAGALKACVEFAKRHDAIVIHVKDAAGQLVFSWGIVE